MPAASSSPTDPAIGQLLTTARARRAVRHQLAVILSLALCAVPAGARSFTAIAEWAADADQATREALGVTGVISNDPRLFAGIVQSDAL